MDTPGVRDMDGDGAEVRTSAKDRVDSPWDVEGPVDAGSMDVVVLLVFLREGFGGRCLCTRKGGSSLIVLDRLQSDQARSMDDR
jgi:hypothetical protein